MTKVIPIPPVLYAMLSHTGREDSRYVNSGILIQYHTESGERSDKVTAVCTDGRRLAYVEWSDPTPGGAMQIMVPAAPIKQLRAPKRVHKRGATSDDKLYLLEVNDKDGEKCRAVSLALAGVRVECNGDDSWTFPSWRDVVPAWKEENRRPDAPCVCLNPGFAVDAFKLHADVAALCATDDRPGPNVWLRNWSKPIVIEREYGDIFAGVVLMPINGWYGRDEADKVKPSEAECRNKAGAEAFAA